MRTTALIIAILLCAPTRAEPILAPAERAARDSARIEAASAAQKDSTQAVDSAREQRQRRQGALRSARSALASLTPANQRLDELERQLGDDLTQVDALVRSALAAQSRRLTVGPIGVDRPELLAQTTQLLQSPATLNVFYDAWFALHEEWLASARVVASDQPLTRRDGVREVVGVTRYGAVGFVHGAQDLVIDPNGGLLETAGLERASRLDGEFLAQQVYDSGAVGVALLICGVAGVLLVLRRLATRFLHLGAPLARQGWLKLLASAAMLLGLLGTVVGLIHTFRALAQFGGSQVSVAAAGISHALSTTWMGLCVAIPLMLARGLLNALPAAPSTPRPRPLRRTHNTLSATPRFALGAVGGAVLGFALFFLMQWLTLRPLAEPVGIADAVTVARIDWTTKPPPPPPPEVVRLEEAPPLVATDALSLPSVEPLAAPAEQVAQPQLKLADGLSALRGGGGVAIGAGTLWSGASSGEQITNGSDLVPISSARPSFPEAALAAGIEGWVEAIFIIDAGGRVSNVRIIDADPPGVFEQAAADALRRWLYAPLYRDGKPVAREATQLLRFALDEARNLDGRRQP
ncbi:MAG: TonB family protein [Gammaproteobacteria bacterium]